MSVLRQWTRRAVLTGSSVMVAGALAGCSWSSGSTAPGEQRTTVTQAGGNKTVADVGDSTLKLEVTINQRIFVPLGAELSVAVTDAKGRKARESITTSTGLPYRIQVPLGTATTGPLSVSVTLKSPAGHVLTGSKSFGKVPNTYTTIVVAN